MSQDLWNAVDAYFDSLLAPPDDALEAALLASQQAGLPAIQVTPTQGKLLMLLAAAIGARRILEIGTLGGYSTLWLARALPADGRLITLELEARHAEVARANLAYAGLADRTEVRQGPALETLAALAAENPPPFDFVFIDADKVNTLAYFQRALLHTRAGGLIVVDNVVRDGQVANAASDDANVQGIRRFLEAAAADARVRMTAIQTVGSKGYDGLALAHVLG